MVKKNHTKYITGMGTSTATEQGLIFSNPLSESVSYFINVYKHVIKFNSPRISGKKDKSLCF